MSKHKHHPHVQKAGTAFVLSGVLVALFSVQMHLQAQLVTGQGAAVGTLQPQELSWQAQDTVMAAAPVQSSAPSVLALGMLLMLIGIGIHAWYILNKGEGTPIPVRIRKHSVQKPQVRKNKKRDTRRQAEVIWIERTIRF